MEKLNRIITAVLASRVSIFIYILMFVYLVIIPLVAMFPGMGHLMPSTQAMLVGDNYTSVLAALAASIASLAGVKIHQDVKSHRAKSNELQKSLDDLHAKVDKLSSAKSKD